MVEYLALLTYQPIDCFCFSTIVIKNGISFKIISFGHDLEVGLLYPNLIVFLIFEKYMIFYTGYTIVTFSPAA